MHAMAIPVPEFDAREDWLALATLLQLPTAPMADIVVTGSGGHAIQAFIPKECQDIGKSDIRAFRTIRMSFGGNRGEDIEGYQSEDCDRFTNREAKRTCKDNS